MHLTLPIRNQLLRAALVCIATIVLVPHAIAQRQMERLGRGVVAMRMDATQVYVGWRMFGDDPESIGFNVYRSANGGGAVLLNGAPITSSCNLVDATANLTLPNSYFVRPVIGGVEQAPSASFTLPANSAIQQFISIPLSPPPAVGSMPPSGDGTDPGGPYTYNANDCSAADLDGDGEYEIILKWDPSNSKDNSQSGWTGNTYLDAYKLNGTRLWRINLGPNIRSGAHYMDFMVFDYDGDGRAEVMCRTAPGSIDGLGNYVGGAAKWQNANGPRPAFNNTDDYRYVGPNGTNGYVLAGPEFLSVFNGLTGEELATATFYPKRDQDNNDDNPTAARINTIWGDSYGNRIDRFLAGVAYLDGKQPSAVFCRGYYTRTFLTAWDWRNGQLTRRWVFDSNDGAPGNLAYRGQGAHSLTIGDVDGDGKDEITYGACAIDDNGKGLYSTGLGHGDAEHLSDMDPNRPGLEVWMVHESPSSYGPTGLEYRDARTGGLLFGVDGQGADVGRGVAIDIDPRYPGYEMWGARGGLMSSSGVQITANRPGQMNFAIWWDADLLREILDGTTISKWNWLSSSSTSILSPGGLSSNNGTKSTPCLTADLLGDWREEVVWRTSDNLALRIYTTTILATNRFYTLMHDPQYRCAVAWQNTGYNQPPHPGFNIGPDMYRQPLSPISDAALLWRGGAGGNAWDVAATANWSTNNDWTGTNAATVFNTGASVLFDISGSNNTAVNVVGSITPGDVTVFSPKDFVFAGSGSISGAARLIKAGQGTLTINNSNSYTGTTTVSGGGLVVNGALPGSVVLVERRGTPEGPSQFGGAGILGQGVTVQAGCIVVVGPGTNSPGTLTISNQFTELGSVLNRFDLSSDPGGIVNPDDVIQVAGNFNVAGTNIIEIRQLNGYLGNGVYPLIKYSGVFNGGLSNFTLTGTFVQPVALTNPPGMIGLVAVMPAAPPDPPSGLNATAIGAFQINLVWTDNSSDENNFLIERSTNNINFSQIASVNTGVTNYSDVGLLANTTYYYRVRGTNLAGPSPYSNVANATTTATPPALTWRGDGLNNLWDIATTADWYNGTNLTLYPDGAFVTFEGSGSNTPAVNLIGVVHPGSLTINASKSYTFGGTGMIAGATSLVKAGSGSLTVTTTNGYSGGTVLSNGMFLPGTIGANMSAFGTGPITFYGGTLQFNGYTSTSTGTDWGANTNDWVVPTGQTGTVQLAPRFGFGTPFTSRLLGGGTLNLVVYYVRGNISGNWSAFNGTINVTAKTSNTNDDFRIGNSAGLPGASVILNNLVTMYHISGNGQTISIGQLAGSAGSRVGPGNGSSATPTWQVGGKNTDATFAGQILDATGTSVTKVGTGAWTLTGINTYLGTTTVNGGKLIVNGDNSAATGAVVVNASGTLGGSGIIGGPVTVNGTLAPGNSIGSLTFNNSLSFSSGSSAVFEVMRTPLANDIVHVLGTVTYGGILTIVNTGLELFEAGDNYQLFDAPVHNGSFSDLNAPDLDTGLEWNTSKLAVDGRIWVVRTTPPSITTRSVVAGNFIFNGTGGTPGWDYYLLTSTNLTLPYSQWTVLATNQFDLNGNFSCTNAVDPNAPKKFYLLRLP